MLVIAVVVAAVCFMYRGNGKSSVEWKCASDEQVMEKWRSKLYLSGRR